MESVVDGQSRWTRDQRRRGRPAVPVRQWVVNKVGAVDLLSLLDSGSKARDQYRKLAVKPNTLQQTYRRMKLFVSEKNPIM